MKKSLILLIISIVITGAGLFASFQYYGEKIRAYNVCSNRYVFIDGTYYSPKTGNPASNAITPGLISIHYGLQNRETLQPALSTAAENGIITFELLLRRKDETGKPRTFEDYVSDARFALHCMLKDNSISEKYIFISGHSIGANISAIAGSGSEAAGIIATGYPAEIDPDIKANMLMTAGVFDELHNPEKMKKAHAKTLDSKNLNNNNSALFFSFLSDHYLEPCDPAITFATIKFINDTTEKSASVYGKFSFFMKIISRELTFLGILIVYFLALMYLRLRIKNSRFSVILFLAAFIILGAMHRADEWLLNIYLISPLFIAVVIFNFYNLKTKLLGIGEPKDIDDVLSDFLRLSAKLLAFLGLLYIAFLMGLIFHAGLYPWNGIGNILNTVKGIIWLPFGYIFVFITRINGLFLNGDFSFNFLNPILSILILAELIYPGGIGRVFDEFSSPIIKGLKDLEFKLRLKSSLPSIVLFSIVFVVCILMWRQIISEGYVIGVGEMIGLAHIFISFIIIPAVLFTVLVRSRVFLSFISRLSFQGER